MQAFTLHVKICKSIACITICTERHQDKRARLFRRDLLERMNLRNPELNVALRPGVIPGDNLLLRHDATGEPGKAKTGARSSPSLSRGCLGIGGIFLRGRLGSR